MKIYYYLQYYFLIDVGMLDGLQYLLLFYIGPYMKTYLLYYCITYGLK